ncbi:hypothetical protein A3E49_02195 [Candidatus Saccharibacteria bacterium RIFCSPHIGHO2_12_FULL_49_19]|nr:MAG: hypothetical protein A2708_01305 [Candidatus Saccharibacteria bacterium RIFCSPHIGHO2_01_FULL_49_21]OGL36826.1 MAG: hypothetical protein A3E49_02195 [Candidatus Saccharibacteria bacterium RIFCSPHIGHO2_12_FULL_49_19]OGL37142.1 MAG: hypothetical protein A3B63_00870 [Candidatus Saccharibacteria bacterium RIFCSPLOWO2_01_FULL_49_22]
MKTLPREKANAMWDKWWDEMRGEWFKLEVLQDYAAEDEGPSLQAWLEGDKQRSITLMLEPSNIARGKGFQKKRSQGVKLIRLHTVQEPYTAYIQWELEHYKHVNKPLWDESIFLINRSEVADLDIPSGDTMIFDKKQVVVNKYNSRGLMTHETFYDEHDDISHFLKLRIALIERAKAL